MAPSTIGWRVGSDDKYRSWICQDRILPTENSNRERTSQLSKIDSVCAILMDGIRND